MYPFGAPEDQTNEDLYHLIEGIKQKLVDNAISANTLDESVIEEEWNEEMEEGEMADSPADPTGEGDAVDEEAQDDDEDEDIGD